MDSVSLDSLISSVRLFLRQRSKNGFHLLLTLLQLHQQPLRARGCFAEAEMGLRSLWAVHKVRQPFLGEGSKIEEKVMTDKYKWRRGCQNQRKNFQCSFWMPPSLPSISALPGNATMLDGPIAFSECCYSYCFFKKMNVKDRSQV